MKKKNKITLLIIVMIIIIGLSFSAGVYLAMKGHLKFLVKPLQPYFGKRFDNNLNMVNTIKQITPKYSFNATTYEEFLKWKEESMPVLYNLLGIDKKRDKLDISTTKTSKKERINNLTRYKISFEGSYNVSIPCYLFVPDTKNKQLPALIVPSGLGQGIIATSGQVESYQKGNAKFLAEKGFVTLTCENRGFGELSHKYIDEARIHANAILIGKTYYGIVLEDQLRALDLLSSLKIVDKTKIGAAGISMGGGLSMYLALFDDRIKTAVVMGYLGEYKKEWTSGDHAILNNIPNFLNNFEASDIGSLIAPKPILYSNGKYDTVNIDDARYAFSKIQKAYSLTNSTNKVQWADHSGAHEFNNEIAYEFLKQQLID